MTFSSENEAIKYGRENLGNEDFELAIIETETSRKGVILCGTDQAYENDLCAEIEMAIDTFASKFDDEICPEDDIDDFNGDTTELTSKIRDLVIEWYEKTRHTEFLAAHDEY